MSVFPKISIKPVLIAAVFSCLLLNIDTAGAQTEVNDAIERYMNALVAGDIETVKQCLGKKLRKRHKNTFKDPAYASFLVNRYDGATFSIVQNRERENGTQIVDVKITFKDRNAMTIRFFLNSSNKIIEEISL